MNKISEEVARERRDLFAKIIATCATSGHFPSGLLRTLSSCWYAYDRYAHGKPAFLNRSGNPHWLNYNDSSKIGLADSFDLISLSASKWHGQKKYKKLHIEHAVPVKQLERLILECPTRSDYKSVEKILRNYLRLALITKVQNKSIQKSWRDSMPKNWNRKDLYARYKRFLSDFPTGLE